MSQINLQFLTDAKIIVDICIMYWSIDNKNEFIHSVSKIAKIFNTNSTDINHKVKIFSIAYSNHIQCHTCTASYRYDSRSDFKEKIKGLNKWQCPSCQQKQIDDEQSSKIHLLKKIQKNAFEHPFTVDELTFKEAVFLLSLIRFSIAEDFTYLKAFSLNKDKRLSPEDDYDIKIYRYLSQGRKISISPLSNLDAILDTDQEGNGQFSYYITLVHWDIVIDYNYHNDFHDFISALEAKIATHENWDEVWAEDAKVLSKDLALQETIAYLQYVMNEHRLDFKPGEKTEYVLSKILEKYSVAECYSLIWSSAKDAAAYYMRGGIPKNQAANSVIGNIERKYERYIINSWDIKPFSRNYALPQSILSQIVYGLAFKTDDGGFNKRLSLLNDR